MKVTVLARKVTLSDFVAKCLHDFTQIDLESILNILTDQMVKTVDDLKEFSPKDRELLPIGARNRLRKGLTQNTSTMDQVAFSQYRMI